MALEFGTPPERIRKGRAGKYVDDAATLRENPGRWAKLDTSGLQRMSKYRLTSGITNGRVAGFTEGGFEARTAGGEVWVRFIGEAESNA
ncbi:hypothetical protein M3G54_01495 [Brevibacterium casei]|uniref:hypothetical protein n=1 Tax=Brevibacterium casei TaxID=33889 RepID=UPI00223A8C6E|nr:hypothetical protein [Brevibacterium casei]MCT2357037.1 hypothetical protein [Brevibacterium casei]